jgi:hypothetical protein
MQQEGRRGLANQFGSSVTLRKWSRSVSRVNRSRITLVTYSVDSSYRPRCLRTVSAGMPLELGAYYLLLTVDGTFC